MRYRPLGNTGYQVSEISFGTIPILQGTVPVLPDYFNLSDEQAVEILYSAYLSGCNLYDTAIIPEYGDAELKLGMFLKKVERNRVIISDKARFFTGEEMYDAVIRSCENLDSHVDIYFVHQVDFSNEEMTFRKYGSIDALCELKAEGKIKLVGVATHYFDILYRGMKDVRVDVLQGSGNIFERGMLERVEAERDFRQKGFLVNKAFAAGVLPSFFSAQELIMGVLSYPISSVILGLGTHEQIKVAMGKEFAEQQRIDFDAVMLRLGRNFTPIPCDRCQRCRCYYGTEIHTMFRQYNYYYLGKEYWALRKLDLDVREQSLRCRQCQMQICLGQCPRDIFIPLEFERIASLVSAHIRKGRI